MKDAGRKPARIVLGFLVAVTSLAIVSASAVGAMTGPLPLQTGEPAPSPSTSCMVAVPPGAPTPSPLCQTVTPSPVASASESPDPEQTSKPPKGKKKPKYSVTIVHRRKAASFVGEVTATGKCQELRRVYVFKLLKGKDERIGKAITDSTARYSVAAPEARGEYYAKAPASVSVGYATEVECEQLKSKPITVSAK